MGEVSSPQTLFNVGEDSSLPLTKDFMDQQKDFTTRVNIGDRDSLGKTIDLRLIAAAQAVWERACLLVIRYLAEDTEAPAILETVVDAASRAMPRISLLSLSKLIF